ncbi:RTA-like protein [Penicillium pulvis]|uniref:RTA-like protein n=1 Tax=Penicillium pulvis TaxID=1562058 RepID=UPI00254866C8|nr:RTA-like protein [Penicillium pulvis]KAJ5797289.1 RTA-like protein [Penicillium pulvis]
MSYQTCHHVSLECPVSDTTYGYTPNLGGNIFFTAFFALLGVAQLGLGVYYRTYTFLIALGVGTFMETAGYVGRVLMHYNPWNESAFKLQIVCLVLAPTFVAAGIYLTLKHIVLNLGPEHSIMKPRLFTHLFIWCDLVSLLMQGAGGGVAAGAGNTNMSLLKAGDDIIIAGIAFQVATMSVCGILALHFFWNVARKGNGLTGEKTVTPAISPNRMRLVIAAEVFAYFTVLIRCIYRLPEMAGGWGNPRMQDEESFLLLDGMMIALATLAFTLVHPGRFIPTIRSEKKSSV